MLIVSDGVSVTMHAGSVYYRDGNRFSSTHGSAKRSGTFFTPTGP